ncbi:hypothetical protein [Flavobacterium sp. GCM10023249]|uniref:hypothetical protein n=1 Tax=unclassified Flavobacterium TaxID=196869 RepID=UPI003612C3F3
MSTNNSQTLFRFTSIRNPQLPASDTQTNLGFIYRPSGISGIFDDALGDWNGKNGTKIEFLEKAAKNIQAAPPSILEFKQLKTVEEIKAIYANYLAIGESLAQNKTINLEDALLVDNAIELSRIPAQVDPIENLWSNLVFQMLTQADFYVKEAIIQTLKGIHYADNHTESNEEILKNAKVVLPAHLFLDDVNPIASGETLNNTLQILPENLENSIPALTEYTTLEKPTSKQDKKMMEVAAAEYTKKRLEALKSEMDKLSKNYKESYAAAYETAQREHQAAIKPILDLYESKLLELEATFTEDVSEAKRDLERSRIEKPVIPEFVFNYQQEIDLAELQIRLSESSRELFETLFVEGPSIRPSDDIITEMRFIDELPTVRTEFQTYSAIENYLGEKITDSANSIFTNSTMEKEEFMSLGGVIVPVVNSGSALPNFTCKLTPRRTLLLADIDRADGLTQNLVDSPISTTAKYNFSLSIEIADPNYQIASIEYEAKELITTHTGTSYTEMISGTTHNLNNLFGQGFTSAELRALKTVSAVIRFENGQVARVAFNPTSLSFVVGTTYQNTLVFDILDTGGNSTPILVPLQYTLCPVNVSQGTHKLELTLNMPDPNWEVTSMTYTLSKPNSIAMIDDYYVLTKSGNQLLFKDLFGTGLPDTSLINGIVNFSIVFNNGKKITFKTATINLNACINGNFIVIDNPGSGSSGSGTTSGTGNTATTPKSFIPKGFGIKRLGIADYLKVEQSIQGYVEGEVAHIENVMARERREKSTRKTTKSEISSLESTDTEKEQLRDTASTDRFEMQSEIAKAIQQTKDMNISAHVDGSYGPISFGVAGSYATHSSKEENTKQALTQAKEVTQKASDKIVTKVHKERTEKMIDEFEENNLHEFDNRKGDKHVVGVYRWVDKVFKNQIYNFGKRMMFEFMIPEPAKLHKLGMEVSQKDSKSFLVKPVDPRTEGLFRLNDYTDVSDPNKLKHWLKEYNVKIEDMLENNITVGASMKMKYEGKSIGNYEGNSDKIEVEIPKGYKVKKAVGNVFAAKDYDAAVFSGVNVTLGAKSYMIAPKSHYAVTQTTHGWWIFSHTHYNVIYYTDGNVQMTFENVDSTNYNTTFPVSYTMSNFFDGNLNIELYCELTPEGKIQEQQRIFNLIIEGYEKALAKYEQKVAAEEAKGVRISGENPGFYRQIENMVLRKNCISYLISQNQNDDLTFGKDHYYNQNNQLVESFTGTDIKVTDKLDQYAELVKFMEQAFEWNIMSYFFYPYYWGNRNNWSKMYLNDNNDPIFRSFLQSGMARVIVTVKPGFENAVQLYLATGKLWNGGEVPVIGDPMYLSIVDELREPEGQKQGKAWPTRIPTTLTILQAESIGLKVEKALPFNEDLSDFENPAAVPQGSNFILNDAQIGQSEEMTGKKIQFAFKGWDSYQTIEEFDADVSFPIVYECMGETIEVDRDAAWLSSSSSQVIYQELAEQLSGIDGVKADALPENQNGILFTVDTDKIKTFQFRKPGGNDAFDFLKIVTDGKSYVKLISPNDTQYINVRLTDKFGQHLVANEINKPLNFNRFAV